MGRYKISLTIFSRNNLYITKLESGLLIRFLFGSFYYDKKGIGYNLSVGRKLILTSMGKKWKK